MTVSHSAKPDPGSRRGRRLAVGISGQAAADTSSRGIVYTLHLWPPLVHAEHYTGAARRNRLPARLTDHALGRGARMLQVQLERGGSWVLGNVQPGGFKRERELKAMHQGSRHCDVCKAVKGHQSGQLSTEQALSGAGWNRATEYERSLLLKIFGLKAAPEKIPQPPRPQMQPQGVFLPGPKPLAYTPEIDAVVDALIAGWSPKAEADREPDPELEARASRAAGPETEREIEASA
jgi:hypothetical protein